MSLQDKVILITGATKGIGRAIAERVVSEGAIVVANYNSDKKAADEMTQKLGADHCLTVQADASNLADIDKLVDAAVSRFGRIDVCIANAGLLHMVDLMSTTEADFDRSYAINVKGPYFLAQKVVPHMKPGSRIIFVSTTLNHHSGVTPNYCLYSSTKGAIEQITRVSAKGLAAKGILVNCVAPGPTATELFLRGKSEQLIERIASANPFNRLGQPEEIASVFAFLCGPDSSWVTGQVIRTNGGMA
ncbi:hypothetical protein VTK73DRAFT_7009 [Phialemonium thermophilum]|uniref:3-oxoacyl-[acyl-carrier protein] reductase n=1 Tax=Phialemonium thermophilum TaxID=223376 RepID=A0ABR3WH63_9PEZI